MPYTPLPLPEDYITMMKSLLQTEFDAFLATYEQPIQRGLRVNPLKSTISQFLALTEFRLEPIPWCKEGFYYQHQTTRPGKHPYHAAGVYYIQEPSAMAPAEALEPQPGERILDLCAAPGGKSTQIAAKMEGKGILVSNEIDSSRANALVENLERCGVKNAVVTNETPARLAKHFRGYFDRILIDAPCSGEGMFRKDNDARGRWSVRSTERAAELQLEILLEAALMLKPGGRLVYSTCTFNPNENEGALQRFMQQEPSFSIEKLPNNVYFQSGQPQWAQADPALHQSARLWPHHLRGEGHFVAVLQKSAQAPLQKVRPGKAKQISAQDQQLLQSFYRDELKVKPPSGNYVLFGEHLYRLHEELPSLKGLKVKRPGFYIGQLKKSRIVPSHALALSLTPKEAQRTINFSATESSLFQYLQGEALPTAQVKGWTLVTVDGFSLGWGKVSGGLLKNHYPKWMRWDENMMSTR
ncbi:RsmF rRNA methyltransferase first C-terminal domain-containing protein [Mechercharimyces sp. CAU 1602]|uniref:RsmF rRNA methyltransferase first C-terminal domain-containing protein n=1 Tax=Mechercharimyces sp. CAU 1602 TaxID=2973933 RepID=UPI0021611857|nr:RsmB/NOP family class I SAM-dependent RNA methyltransferase [Mechercharimyces sp. CAU 1602]MCS1351540.1 RsmB/NOP family class I SAM-dependent RNA methyltransferase [Mechercharimyces sp. CAU 1602]